MSTQITELTAFMHTKAGQGDINAAKATLETQLRGVKNTITVQVSNLKGNLDSLTGRVKDNVEDVSSMKKEVSTIKGEVSTIKREVIHLGKRPVAPLPSPPPIPGPPEPGLDDGGWTRVSRHRSQAGPSAARRDTSPQKDQALLALPNPTSRHPLGQGQVERRMFKLGGPALPADKDAVAQVCQVLTKRLGGSGLVVWDFLSKDEWIVFKSLQPVFQRARRQSCLF